MRRFGGIERAIAEEDTDDLETKLVELKIAFGEFEKSHDAYHDTLIEELDLDQSEAWFTEVEQTYIKIVNEAKAVLRNIDGQSESGSRASEHNGNNDQATSANQTIFKGDSVLSCVPRVEIHSFDGNPSNFQTFLAVFDELVDKVTDDGQMKLTRLLQYTAGVAKGAMRNCALIGGERGYRQARENLTNRFGNPHIVSRKIIDDLKTGKPVSRSVELQQLADDLQMALAALESLGMSYKLDNQQSIVEILGRCKPFVVGRWKRTALDHKRIHDSYPSFSKFVEFMVGIESEVCDPVYGADPKGSRVGVVNACMFEPVEREKYDECVVCGQSHCLFYCEFDSSRCHPTSG